MSLDAHWRMRAARLPAMFANNARTVGTLTVPTGRIVIADGIAMLDFTPLERHVPVGEYPVEASLATTKSGERLAAVRITFSPQPIADWEPAPEGDIDGTGGLGVMMDVQAVPAFEALVDECAGDWWHEPWIPKQSGPGWKYGCFEPSETDSITCAFFTPGAYEGTCHSYWALDAQGMPVMLVTDLYTPLR